jgi:hypothetical protein
MLKALAGLTTLTHLNLSCSYERMTSDGLLPLLPNLISLNLLGCTLRDDHWGNMDPTAAPGLSLRTIAQHGNINNN